MAYLNDFELHNLVNLTRQKHVQSRLCGSDGKHEASKEEDDDGVSEGCHKRTMVEQFRLVYS